MSSWYDRWIRCRDNYWIGRWFELRGNIVTIDGCSFDISAPAIRTDAKSWFAFGRYERPERRAVERYLDPDTPVIEFGGSVGVVACVTNRKLRRRGDHIVVEANPDLVPVLEANRDRNGGAFTVLHRAVSYAGAEVEFFPHANFLGGSTRPHSATSIRVPATTLGELVQTYGYERITLICDIEGGELELVARDATVLRHHVALMIMEFHPWLLGAAGVAGLLRDLSALGFTVLHSEEDTYVLRNQHLA